jgi:hypothetical protein
MRKRNRIRFVLLTLLATAALVLSNNLAANAGYAADCIGPDGERGTTTVHTVGESPYGAVTYVTASHTALGFTNFNVNYTDRAGVHHSFNRNTNKTWSYVTVSGHGVVFQGAIHWTISWGAYSYRCGL